MKTTKFTLVSILILCLFSTQAESAKANFERTKPDILNKAVDPDSDCDGLPTGKRAQCKAKKQSNCKKCKLKFVLKKGIAAPKPNAKPTNIKARAHNATRSNKTSASKVDKPTEICAGRDDDCNG
ncbi:MAG: hypothetical protein Q9M92_11620 [Enterobacterales bacterium]|nr:hypothetical protein [Enterobacterales bacterium]